jgi:hypothetical protein
MGGEAKEGVQTTKRVADVQEMMNEFWARKKAKKDAEKARWDFYNDQLSKGNSNIGRGAKKATRRRGKLFRYK